MKFANFTKKQKIYGLAILSLFTLMSLAILTPGKSFAAAFASTTFPNPAASSPYPLYMTVGSGEFDGSVAISLIEADSPGPVKVTIEEGQWCNNNTSYPGYGRALDLPKSGTFNQPYFETLYEVEGYDLTAKASTGTLAGPLSSGFTSNCVNRDLVMGFTFPSGCDAGGKKCIAIFKGSVGATNLAYTSKPGAAENSFRITLAGANNPLATFLPSKANIYPSFFNMSNRNRPNESEADYDINFTLPCSITTSKKVGIQFGDVDDANVVGDNSSAYQSSTNFPMTMKFDLNPPGYSSNIISGNGLIGDGLTQVFEYDLQPNTPYSFHVTGLSYINAITYSINVPDEIILASNSCSNSPKCTITNVVSLSTGGAVYAKDPIRFDVNTTGVNSGRQLGVNGPDYGNTTATGGFSNYLVTANQFARGSPVGVGAVTIAGKEGTLPSTGTTTIDDIMFGTSGDGSLTQIIAPSTPGTYPFNWGLVNPGVAWDGITCSGTVTVISKPITISGRVYNAYNTATNYEGINIDTCVTNVSAKTGSDGNYSFVIPSGTKFCVKTADRPNSAKDVNTRPVGEDYSGCTKFTADRTPNYCSSTSYIDQYAGVTNANGTDRSIDTGYDLVFRFAPKQRCVVGANATSEIGTAYVPSITVYNTGDSNMPPIETGNIDLTINGTTSSGDYTPSGTKLTYGNSISTPVGFTMSPASIPLPNAQTYTITAGFSSISPGAGDGYTAINDNVGGGNCEGSTSTIRAAEPYVRVYGSDIIAGGGFASTSGTCNTLNAGVYGFASGTGTSYQGSGSQYGIITHSKILSFFSASNRSGANTPPRGLTFSNTISTEDFGSDFGGTPPCISDYFSDPSSSPAPLNGGTRDPAVQEISSWPGVVVPGKRRYVANAGNVTIAGLNVPSGSQGAIYIDGNLAITGDITFGSAATIDKLPNLAVIVRGNIYITPNVKRIDGLYVAQPKNPASPTDGRIYTCAKPTFDLYTSSELTTQCGTPNAQQLAVNGALIAQQVKFLRTMFSVKDSPVSSTNPGDMPNFSDGSASGNGANTKAAEVINYTPEIFLAPSALKDPTQSCLIASCKYDSIFSLPPIY